MFAVRERFKLDWITVIGVGILFFLFIIIFIYLIWRYPTTDTINNEKSNSTDQPQSPFDDLPSTSQESSVPTLESRSAPILINRDKVEEANPWSDALDRSEIELDESESSSSLDEADDSNQLERLDEVDDSNLSNSLGKTDGPEQVSEWSRSAYSRQFDRYLASVELETPQVYGGRDSKFEAMVSEEVRKLFPETIFYKCRPKWLKNTETNCSLEFDLYTHYLEGRNVKMAVEAHGYQHRTFPNRFHRTKAQFDQQRRRDELKVQYCRDLRIILLIVWDDKNTPSKIRNDLIQQLQIYGIIPKSIRIDK